MRRHYRKNAISQDMFSFILAHRKLVKSPSYLPASLDVFCWEIPENVCSRGNGYSQLWNGKTNTLLHRFVLERKLGRSVQGLACHHCDRSWCLNDNHLYEGTRASNSDDLARRGKNRKLSDDDILCLLECMVLDGMSRSALATEFGVSTTTVQGIRQGFYIGNGGKEVNLHRHVRRKFMALNGLDFIGPYPWR